MCGFPRTVVTQHQTVGGLKDRNVLSPSSGVWMLKIKMQAVLVLLRALREDLLLSPSRGGLRHSLTFRWHSLCVFTLSSLYMSVSVSNFPLNKGNSPIR